MSPRTRQWAERREALVLRCQAEREQLARSAQPLESAFRLGDRAVRVAVFLRVHPFLTVLGVTAVMVASRGRLLRWIAASLPFVGLAMRAGRLFRRS
ncbi:MAG: YqjK family protein [Burkholderiales bacterium]